MIVLAFLAGWCAGSVFGCVSTAWWISYMLSFYDRKPEPLTGPDGKSQGRAGGQTLYGNVQSTDGLGNTTEYRPHWRRSGP